MEQLGKTKEKIAIEKLTYTVKNTKHSKNGWEKKLNKINWTSLSEENPRGAVAFSTVDRREVRGH